MAFFGGQMTSESLHQSPATANVAGTVPRLQEPIQLTNDTTMRDEPDVATGIDERLSLETSDDEDSDSMTDESSVDEDRVVPFGLPVSKLPTGLCYDERMRYHSEVSAPTGDSVHPEDPRRIYYIYKELCEAGLVAEATGYPPVVSPPLKRIAAREATKEEICLVHTEPHYEFVKRTADMSDEDLIDLSESPRMDSIYFNALSYYAGKLSAGGVIETCRAVASRQVKNAIAVVRPPGHHAEVSCTMGFCLFNNTCIASRVCQNDFGEACRKILILDWDVHHGNGCQKAFYNDPNILYISLHVHMHGQFYPSGPEGDMYHCGEGLGIGKNINIPWETKGMGDGDYMYAFQHVVMPIATEFNPDMVIVAAGFDAAAGDELGGCFVSPPCYAHMTHMLMSLADGKIAICLEGGYNFQAISKSALAVTRTLMGEPPDRLFATQPTQKGIHVVQKVREIQSKYWRSIYPKSNSASNIPGGERMNDIIREWQAMHLYDKHRLTELLILRDNVSRSFKNQVLASPNYETKKNLFLFFHDPPDLMSKPDPLTNKQKLHETWMLDATQSYIAQAQSLGMGIIDVNIPEHITLPVSSTTTSTFNPAGHVTDSNNDNNNNNPYQHRYQTIEYADKTSDLARKEGEKLAIYLWENYIEPYDFSNLIVIGSGHAFHAVARLLSEQDHIHELIPIVISFISEQPVRALTSTHNNRLGYWYRDASRVYVAHDHLLWAKEVKSKKYGRCIRAPADVVGLNGMMMYYKDEVWKWIADAIGDSTDDSDEVGGGPAGYEAAAGAVEMEVKDEDKHAVEDVDMGTGMGQSLSGGGGGDMH